MRVGTFETNLNTSKFYLVILLVEEILLNRKAALEALFLRSILFPTALVSAVSQCLACEGAQ